MEFKNGICPNQLELVMGKNVKHEEEAPIRSASFSTLYLHLCVLFFTEKSNI